MALYQSHSSSFFYFLIIFLQIGSIESCYFFLRNLLNVSHFLMLVSGCPLLTYSRNTKKLTETSIFWGLLTPLSASFSVVGKNTCIVVLGWWWDFLESDLKPVVHWTDHSMLLRVMSCSWVVAMDLGSPWIVSLKIFNKGPLVLLSKFM